MAVAAVEAKMLEHTLDSSGTVVRCRACGNKLGVLVAGLFVQRHAGREGIYGDVKSVRCEKCGWAWQPGIMPREEGA